MFEHSEPYARGLKFMYAYTAAGAGPFGLAMLLAPAWLAGLLGMPAQDPIVFGMVGSTYLAFACLGLLGLRAPMRFAPVLLLQLIYKSVWFAVVMLPVLLSGHAPVYALLFAGIFATFILGDLIVIPFRQLFAQA